MRDNALVSALRTEGHDAVMALLYLPFFIDETDTSSVDRIFFGGINVYLQQKVPLFRRTPRWIDSLFDFPALLKFSARQAGMTKAAELGEMSLSMLEGENGHQKKELERLLQWLRSQAPFDVVCLSNCMLLGLAGPIRRDTNAPVLCTLQGEDGFLDALPNPYRELVWEKLRQRAADVDCFVPVSHYYAGVMKRRMNIPEGKVFVIQNGISLQGYDPYPNPNPGRAIGYLARLCEDKGLRQLVSAFIHLKKRPRYGDVRLKIAGTVTALDEIYVKKIKDQLRKEGLWDSVEFHPNISREDKICFLRSLRLFSVPALYGESFGLYVLEALASGVPVVQPRHAGFEEIVEQTGGGLLYRGDDPADYLQTLETLLDNPEQAQEMGRRGKEEVFRYFHMGRMARDFVRLCETLTARRADEDDRTN